MSILTTCTKLRIVNLPQCGTEFLAQKYPFLIPETQVSATKKLYADCSKFIVGGIIWRNPDETKLDNYPLRSCISVTCEQLVPTSFSLWFVHVPWPPRLKPCGKWYRTRLCVCVCASIRNTNVRVLPNKQRTNELFSQNCCFIWI